MEWPAQNERCVRGALGKDGYALAVGVCCVGSEFRSRNGSNPEERGRPLLAFLEDVLWALQARFPPDFAMIKTFVISQVSGFQEFGLIPKT